MKATQEDLKKIDRLKKRSDFLRANDRSKDTDVAKWVAKSMIVLTVPNEAEKPRFGITVTKKLEKSAVRRNRMKRRLRAAARDVLPAKGQAGMDYVLIARADTATKPYKELTGDLAWCLRKLGHSSA